MSDNQLVYHVVSTAVSFSNLYLTVHNLAFEILEHAKKSDHEPRNFQPIAF